MRPKGNQISCKHYYCWQAFIFPFLWSQGQFFGPKFNSFLKRVLFSKTRFKKIHDREYHGLYWFIKEGLPKNFLKQRLILEGLVKVRKIFQEWFTKSQKVYQDQKVYQNQYIKNKGNPDGLSRPQDYQGKLVKEGQSRKVGQEKLVKEGS